MPKLLSTVLSTYVDVSPSRSSGRVGDADSDAGSNTREAIAEVGAGVGAGAGAGAGASVRPRLPRPSGPAVATALPCAVRLATIVAQSGRHVAHSLLTQGWLDVAQRFLLTGSGIGTAGLTTLPVSVSSQAPAPAASTAPARQRNARKRAPVRDVGLELQMETLLLWRVMLAYGFEAHGFSQVYVVFLVCCCVWEPQVECLVRAV